MSEKNDIMDRYFRGEFIDRQAIEDAIDEIRELMLVVYTDNMTADEAVETSAKQIKRACIDIIRKHTGVSE